jgi:hypothetical protein
MMTIYCLNQTYIGLCVARITVTETPTELMSFKYPNLSEPLDIRFHVVY